ncbi:hypothetical protein [Arsenicicoccus sp. oral taxon 190]|uniref:hypothetical protein n=1 Tax=Arsenicicoccus sp. oral taxon 190 TaxID=1658671 RepID=UPI00067A3B4F|nr:hypothetical protein [Arsenicicoccus sp. oral taxon 190]AKT51919.1 hypothetical protein ADJ73_12680 [Arsenicicoccus sp. oral taxon 190]
MTRHRYYSVVFPILCLVLGYLGYWLHEHRGLEYGPTGIAIAVLAIAGGWLPHHRPEPSAQAGTPTREPRP